MQIKTTRGLDLPIAGAPQQVIHAAPDVRAVGLIGSDYPGLRPRMHVAAGDRVRLGQVLFSDKSQPDVRFTSPGCGVVETINRGPRRVLQSVVVALDGDAEETFPAWESAGLDALDEQTVRANMLASGLWTALRTRPFSRVPPADGKPSSLFVTAIDTNPLAADPETVIAERQQDFIDGLHVLAGLGVARIFVCTHARSNVPVPDRQPFVHARFDGPHPAGLPGTHIHLLDPVSTTKTVWHIGYQDTMALGRLFTTGRIDTERVVALGGPMVRAPRLLRTRLGASTAALARGELEAGECRVVSGSALAGRHAAGWARFLGRYHHQITVLAEGSERAFLGWLAPGAKRYSASGAFLSSLLPRRRFSLTTAQNGSPRAFVPIGNFERVLPLDILPAPLLKALVVRDTESAKRLGCLELDEEDLALLTFVDCGKYEYGEVLRENLEMIEREG